MNYKIAIVDDEPLARKGLRNYIETMPELDFSGSCEDIEALELLLQTESPDILCLDINMPGTSGIEFLRQRPQRPLVIVVTAHPDYALEGYELDIIDYLLKPVSAEKFQKAVSKAITYLTLKNKSQGSNAVADDHFFIKCSKRIERIRFSDILYIEAFRNYIHIYTEQDMFTSLMTLQNIEKYLPAERFFKLQKSFIVSLDKINSIESSFAVIGNKRISISRELKTEFMSRILDKQVIRK